MKVGVVGAATHDTIEIGDGPSRSRPGGTPLYAARALRSVGAEPCAVEIGSLGSLIAHGPDGTRQEILSLPPPLTPQRLREQVLPALAGCAWVLLGGQTAGDFPATTIAALVAAGHSVCLDGQGLARGSSLGPVRLGAISQSDIAGVTALKLNEAEAAAAGSLKVPELLVTRAERGVAVTWCGGRQEIAGDGERFGDPTGAGDSFAALYCLGRSRGQTPPDAARYALDGVQRLYRGEP
jgi:sugar/nucleoside kinase (ribokinase family)